MLNKKSRIVFSLLLTILFHHHLTYGEIFVWQDQYGQKHYSDKPHKNAQVLSIKPGYAWLKVKYVYDGDTIILENKTKVRLSAINTPEIESRYQTGEPVGEQARQWLTKRLKNMKIRLETGPEKRDKYGRLIAHVFTEDGSHINALLVKNGLAFITVHPPNLSYIDTLISAQQEAENAKRGLWGQPYFAPKPYNDIKGKYHKSWKRITGTVKHIQSTRHNVYLKFSDQFAVKIARKYLSLFPDPEIYSGKKIEARGWIHKSRHGYNLMIRHPVDIVILND